MDSIAFNSYNRAKQEVKHMYFDQVIDMIKSENQSPDALRKKFPNFTLDDIQMLVEYIGKHPTCSFEELKEKFRRFN